MPDKMKNFKNLISDIYECQKKIMVNQRFIRELETYGHSDNTGRLKYEIGILQRKIAAFQHELKVKFRNSEL